MRGSHGCVRLSVYACLSVCVCCVVVCLSVCVYIFMCASVYRSVKYDDDDDDVRVEAY